MLAQHYRIPNWLVIHDALHAPASSPAGQSPSTSAQCIAAQRISCGELNTEFSVRRKTPKVS